MVCLKLACLEVLGAIGRDSGPILRIITLLEMKMKKQITFTALSLLTLVGGSWLAAQQRDSAGDTRSRNATPDVSVQQDESGEEGAASETVTEKRFMGATRNGATIESTQRATRPRPAQDARGPAEFREDEVRFPEEARRFDEARVFVEEPYVMFGAQGEHYNVARFNQLGFPQQRMTPDDAARMRAFQDAIRELREAENTEEKTFARERVTKLVSEQLDADLENREVELAAIEQRAKELRKQLDERKTAKPELLKMLVMLIDNPQVGLGIPPEWMQMLMRGQPERYRQGPNAQTGTTTLGGLGPAVPPRPALPPRASGFGTRSDMEEPAQAFGKGSKGLGPAGSPH